MNINSLRQEYRRCSLDVKDLNPDPFLQFQKWFTQAQEGEIQEPHAMILATATLDGKPSSRTVLLKGVDKGFKFFTNLESRKARELNENPFASITFLWRELERQILIDGYVQQIPRKEVEIYFMTRPRGSQIASWASPQSEPIDSRDVLETAYKEYQKKFEGKAVSLPPYWGGYELIPSRFEFWQGRENRLHDRFQYELRNGLWLIQRLAP